ncbi:hypothetical protein [Flavobacterium cheongpyeongense]|uniref:hypothetical protein n=1 Tax=Flavobacterium cheongpyeongense TaxID=2212651 RepID=UPI001403895F|nr:hypothetical protein [Flavobacterium cheongpyeongense]
MNFKTNQQLSDFITRYTFATTVILTNGIPIESVSKMPGHKNGVPQNIMQKFEIEK